MASHFQHPNQTYRDIEELTAFFETSLARSMGPEVNARYGAARMVEDIEAAGRLKGVLFALKGV